MTLAVRLFFSLPFLRGEFHPVSPALPSSSPNWSSHQSLPHITQCRVIRPKEWVQFLSFHFLSFFCSGTFSSSHSLLKSLICHWVLTTRWFQQLPSSTHPPVPTFAQLPVISYLPPFTLETPSHLLAPISACQNATAIFSNKCYLPYAGSSDSKSSCPSKSIHTRYDLTCLESPLHFALFWKWHTLSRTRAHCELAKTTNTLQCHSKLPFL